MDIPVRPKDEKGNDDEQAAGDVEATIDLATSLYSLLSMLGKRRLLERVGQVREAAAAYEDNIRRAEQLDDARQVAVDKIQLGTVHMLQRRYPEALAAYAEARARFTQLDEPAILADIETDAGNPAAAAEAKSKAIVSYLAYRRAGGENHDAPGRIALTYRQKGFSDGLE